MKTGLQNKKNVLHIVNDDKFIDGLISFLDSNKIDYVQNIFVNVNKEFFNHIKNSDRITLVKKADFLDFLRKANTDAVVLHSLYVLPFDLIVGIPDNIKVFWVSWGYDVYWAPNDRLFAPIRIGELLHKETLKAVGKNSFIENVRRVKPYLFYYSKLSRLFRKALHRIDYYSGILDVEYDLMAKNRFIKAKQFCWSYPISSDTIEAVCSENIDLGPNILLGNSADTTNNHIDAIKVLSKYITTQKVIIPLSYAGNDDYKKKVQEKAVEYLHDNVQFLLDFMPYNDYMKIIKSCSTCVFNHERQQAMGNIYVALIMGCVVYLSSTSVAYKYLKSKGYLVYTIQEDLAKNGLCFNLSAEQKQHNKQLFKSISDSNNFIQDFYNLL